MHIYVHLNVQVPPQMVSRTGLWLEQYWSHFHPSYYRNPGLTFPGSPPLFQLDPLFEIYDLIKKKVTSLYIFLSIIGVINKSVECSLFQVPRPNV